MISYIAGSASFKCAASDCCAVDWLAKADPRLEATGAGPSSRTFCWLSTFSVVTHRLVVAEAMLPVRLMLVLHGDRTGRAADRRRTREAPRSRGEADMVLCALFFFFSCRPGSQDVSQSSGARCRFAKAVFARRIRGARAVGNLPGAYRIMVQAWRRSERKEESVKDSLISSTQNKDVKAMCSQWIPRLIWTPMEG